VSVAEDAVAGAVFAALADPTRRAVVRRLSQGGAAMVVAEPAGREVRYRLTPAPFAEAMLWMASTGARWDERLARLEQRLAQRAGGG